MTTSTTAAGPHEHACPECGCECKGAVEEIEAAAPYRKALERLVDAIWAVQHAEDDDEEAESKLEHAKAYDEARALLPASGEASRRREVRE